MGKVTPRETLLTFKEGISVQQKHEKLKVEEAVPQQSRVCLLTSHDCFCGWNHRNALTTVSGVGC